LAVLGVGERIFEGGGSRPGARSGKAQTLVPEISVDRLPAAVHRAEHRGSRHSHVGVVDLRRSDRTLAERGDLANLDTVKLRIHQEIGNALLLPVAGRRARDEQAIIAQVHAGSEYLLAVDYVVSAGSDGPGRNRRRIGTRLRLGQTDAERQFHAIDPAQEPPLVI